ncbi:MAG: hypothetical protein AB7K24_08450 [Gemmataceae bacterium]
MEDVHKEMDATSAYDVQKDITALGRHIDRLRRNWKTDEHKARVKQFLKQIAAGI